jgi:hypothetical protein
MPIDFTNLIPEKRESATAVVAEEPKKVFQQPLDVQPDFVFGLTQPQTIKEPRTFGTVRQKKSSAFWQKTRQAWDIGGRAVDLDFQWRDVKYGRMTREQAEANEAQFDKFQKENPLTARNWVERLYLKTVGIAHPMASGEAKGLTYGVIGAGIGAMAVPGPDPLDPITAPGGFKIGHTVGAFSYWAEQGEGSIYKEAIKAGLSHKTASTVSSIGGPLYGAIEFSQVDRLIPGLGKFGKKTVLSAIVGYLKRVGLEVLEEGEQKAITEGATKILGAALENKIKLSDLPDTLKQIGLTSLDEIKESVGPMTILALPGGSIDVGKAVITRPSKQQQLSEALQRKLNVPKELADEAARKVSEGEAVSEVAETLPEPTEGALPAEKTEAEVAAFGKEVEDVSAEVFRPEQGPPLTPEELQRNPTIVIRWFESEKNVRLAEEGKAAALEFLRERIKGTPKEAMSQRVRGQLPPEFEKFAEKQLEILKAEKPPEPPAEAVTLYHGGPKGIKEIDPSYADMGDIRGAYFTDEADYAAEFARMHAPPGEGEVRQYQVTLKNPANEKVVEEVENELRKREQDIGIEFGIEFYNAVTQELKIRGYDSVIRETGGGTEYIVFDKKSIKPAPTPKPAFAEPPVDTVTEAPASKLIRVLKTTKPVQKFVAETRHAVMKKKVGKVAKAIETGEGEQAFRDAKRELRGALPSGEVEPLIALMSPAEINSLVEQLRNSNKLLPLEKISAYGGPDAKGLWGLIHEGQIPQPKQVELLEREFAGLTETLAPKRPLAKKVTEAVIDAANLPRTFLTAYDLSASLRQTFISGVRHPVLWSKSFGAQVKAFASKENAIAVQNDIRGSKYYPDAVRAGLYLPDVASVSGPLSARPEEFVSRFARAIPGVRASERAFITMGNKMRFELFSKYAKLWENTGKTVGDFKQLAKYINQVTGRGSLGALENQGAVLSAFLFSPRYLTSRFQVLAKAAQAPAGAVFKDRANPVSKIAAGDVAAFVGLNLAVLATAKMFWGDDIDVELDPRSSDFAKIRIGKSRFELWSGFQPIMKYAVRIATGQSKSAVTGKVRDVDRIDVAARFLRSKLAPVPSFIVDLKTGTSFIGDEMTVASLRKMPPENLAFQRFFPLAGQEIWDAFTYQGGAAAWTTIPAATLGVGVGSWDHSAFQMLSLQRDELAQKYYGDKWDNIGPNAQKQITRLNPELDQLARQAKFERTSFAFVGDILERERAAGKEVASKLPSTIQADMNRLQVSIGSLPSSIGTWQLSDERYEQYKNLIAENLKISKLITTESYRKASDKFKIRRLENAIKSAKERARRKIRNEAVKKDVGTRTEEPIFNR